MLMLVSPKVVYALLGTIDQVDALTGARYREMAQDILATPSVRLDIRQAIADRLNHANHRLETKTVGSEDSY